MRRFLILLIAGLWLAGCARGSGPAPVVYGTGESDRRSGGDSTASASAPRAQVGQAGIHTVRRGQTLSGIAVAYEVPMRRIAAANGLERPYLLRVGQRLRIPIQRRYTVERGDTVYDIARAFQVPIRAIIDANNLEPPYLLRVDQALRIPVPRKHVVDRGDTLYGISRQYGVDLSELARLNGLRAPYTINPGQQLLIPASGGGGETRVASRAPSTASGSPERETRDRSSPGDSPDARANRSQDRAPSATKPDTAAPSSGADTSATAPDAQATRTAAAEPASNTTAPRVDVPKPRVRPAGLGRSAAPAEIPTPPARASGRFAWPLRGDIIAGFGPQDGGLHNDGINIAVSRGTPIKAAENGVVAYVGNELRGFGNLLLIKHADNWITAYAHCDDILVERGARVRRGQTIARVGSSGGVTRPQLHFEIRRGSEAVDPTGMMGQMQASL